MSQKEHKPTTQKAVPEFEEEAVYQKYERITKALIAAGRHITTMESCTAGSIASLLTDTEGASSIFEGAFITYSNEDKITAGVDRSVIEQFGVYSPEMARAMAQACRRAKKADIGIGVTGCFGNVDPANRDGIPGQVDAAIAFEKTVYDIHMTIPAGLDRRRSKLFAAGMIGEALLGILLQSSDCNS